MVQHRTFWVVGGDGRQRALRQLLQAEGHSVLCLGLEEGEGPPAETASTDCILLPLPVSGREGFLNAPLAGRSIPLEEVFRPLSPGQPVFGGRVDRTARALAERRGVEIRDYFLREDFTIANAVPTAEGALQLAMEELPTTIHGSKVLVLGFGRVGRLTARRFQALGAEVTVSARRYESLAWAAAEGLRPVLLGRETLPDFDLVVNTVPAPVLDGPRLARLRPGALVLDLASKPGGLDWEAAKALPIRTIHALSLPGKVAPVTAAAAIRDAVFHMLEEQGP